MLWHNVTLSMPEQCRKNAEQDSEKQSRDQPAQVGSIVDAAHYKTHQQVVSRNKKRHFDHTVSLTWVLSLLEQCYTDQDAQRPHDGS